MNRRKLPSVDMLQISLPPLSSQISVSHLASDTSLPPFRSHFSRGTPPVSLLPTAGLSLLRFSFSLPPQLQLSSSVAAPAFLSFGYGVLGFSSSFSVSSSSVSSFSVSSSRAALASTELLCSPFSPLSAFLVALGFFGPSLFLFFLAFGHHAVVYSLGAQLILSAGHPPWLPLSSSLSLPPCIVVLPHSGCPLCALMLSPPLRIPRDVSFSFF